MGVYVLLFIVGSNIGTHERPRYEAMASIQQEYSSKNTCNVALANLLKQVYSKADVLTAQCTEK